MESLGVVGRDLEVIDSVLANPGKLMGGGRGTSVVGGGEGRRDGNVFLVKKSLNQNDLSCNKRTGFGTTFTSPERSGVGKGLESKKTGQCSRGVLLGHELRRQSRGPRDYEAKQSEKMEALRNFMEQNVHSKNRDSQSKLESPNMDSDSGMNSQDLGNGHEGVHGNCLIQFQ